MPLKIVTIPVHDPRVAEEEFNGFVRSHRVVTVERRFVEQGTSSFWTFCIDYLDTGQTNSGAFQRGVNGRGKIDYKEVLKPEEFAVFAKLRDLRKEIAQAEAVPMYTIFTNDQLAKIVQSRVQNQADLENVAGIGDSRVAKYGARVLALLAAAWQTK